MDCDQSLLVLIAQFWQNYCQRAVDATTAPASCEPMYAMPSLTPFFCALMIWFWYFTMVTAGFM